LVRKTKVIAVADRRVFRVRLFYASKTLSITSWDNMYFTGDAKCIKYLAINIC
jgi:hypothetical protein